MVVKSLLLVLRLPLRRLVISGLTQQELQDIHKALQQMVGRSYQTEQLFNGEQYLLVLILQDLEHSQHHLQQSAER